MADGDNRATFARPPARTGPAFSVQRMRARSGEPTEHLDGHVLEEGEHAEDGFREGQLFFGRGCCHEILSEAE